MTTAPGGEIVEPSYQDASGEPFSRAVGRGSMKAPFIWFGGKRKVAPQIWEALGDVDNYVEPFAGSLAVLLARPHDLGEGSIRVETVNDADHFLANFWRALALDPDGVAAYADWPVNEDDLFARHLWLVTKGREILSEGIESDPMFYDSQVAGWWVWGQNAWIGGGWCTGKGPWRYADDGTVSCSSNGEEGVTRVLPHLGTGRGINRQLPHLGAGQGINRKRPHLGDAGQGINRQRLLGDAEGAEPSSLEYRREALTQYCRDLAGRLREVRVCTGDWSRVVTTGALSCGGTVGVFLDPPYSWSVRQGDLYASDSPDVAVSVREWCLANGSNPRYRIILAGYADEHDHLMPEDWRRIRWSAGASYQNSSGLGKNQENRHNEVLWLSPACLDPAPTLFDKHAL